MRFPTIWYVRPAKAKISLRIRAVWSEPFQVPRILYECSATDWTSFEVSKTKRRLQRLVRVYTCLNVKLLEISCHGYILKSFNILLTFKSRFKSDARMIESQVKCFPKIMFSSIPFYPIRRKLVGQQNYSPWAITKHTFTIPKHNTKYMSHLLIWIFVFITNKMTWCLGVSWK